MAFLYKGDAILKGNLSVNSRKPLDSRSIVQNTTELLTIDASYAYIGMPVVSIDDAAIYILLDVSKISDIEGWKKIGNVVINGTEIDLNSFITTSELNSKLELNNTTILEEVDNKIETATSNIESTYAKKIDIPVIPTFKTINDQEITGEGNISIPGDGSSVTIDDTLTKDSPNPVKSSGIYNGVKTMINAKFVVLTEAEYKAMASHDANTFYYIKQ